MARSVVRLLLLAVLAAGALAAWRHREKPTLKAESFVLWSEPEDGMDAVQPPDTWTAALAAVPRETS